MPYVITCGDEGVQINEGTRLGILGAGLDVPRFAEVVELLKKTLNEELRIASSEENDWTKKQLQLSEWEQTNASMQQRIEALADSSGLLYSGFLPFTDPRQLKHDIKGHMVRPHGVHIANKVSLTIGGGEQTYNLGNYVISADWVADAPDDLVKEFIQTQIDFYQSLAGETKLMVLVEEEGALSDDQKAANKAKLEAVGLI